MTNTFSPACGDTPLALDQRLRARIIRPHTQGYTKRLEDAHDTGPSRLTRGEMTSAAERVPGQEALAPGAEAGAEPTMPNDGEEKATAKPRPAFDFDNRPRVRPTFFLTPDDPPAEPAMGKQAQTPEGESAPEFDPKNPPWVRPRFRVTTARLGGKGTPQEAAPALRKTPGEDWRARTLAERANQPPAQPEEPPREGQAALREFLGTAPADAQAEAQAGEDEQEQHE